MNGGNITTSRKAGLPMTTIKDELREIAQKMAADHVISGSPGPLFNAGWAAACQSWAKRLNDMLSAAPPAGWVSVKDRLPEEETPVLILRNKVIFIGKIKWERPTFEDTYEPFRYWDDPNDYGKEWEWDEITHWMPLPSPPGEKG